jgi:transcriptional regulator with XRE-family HTH domain
MTMSATDDGCGSIVRRTVLGNDLRRLRANAGLSHDQAARAIGGSKSKISRLENGKISVKLADVEALLAYYGGVSDSEQKDLLDNARYANALGWWDDYSDVLTPWFRTYLGYESSASVMRTYEIQFIPGLLQTEAYMRAVAGAGEPSKVDRRVALRRKRQEHLTRPGFKCWVIIDEAALHRIMCDRKVMREQLRHLLSQMKRYPTAIKIQIIPFDAGYYKLETGAFTLFRFEEKRMPDIAYQEHLADASFLSARQKVERYLRDFADVSLAAMKPEDSPDFIEKIMRSL